MCPNQRENSTNDFYFQESWDQVGKYLPSKNGGFIYSHESFMNLTNIT